MATPTSPTKSAPPQEPAPYQPRHPDLTQPQEADLAGPWRTPTASDPLRGMEEVHPGIFAGPVFSESWCQRVIEEVTHRNQWRDSSGGDHAPNTMHHSGVLATEIGIASSLNRLMQEQLQAFVEAHLAEHHVGKLVDCHAYVVTYSAHEQADLGFHVDDSQVTLNLCLGSVFEGSELYFEGARCARHVDTQAHPTERFEWKHTPGVAVIHAGKQRHGVRPIHSGRRLSLIAWFRDASGRQRWDDDWASGHCPDWCGQPPNTD